MLATVQHLARVEYFAVIETNYEISRECVASVELWWLVGDGPSVYFGT